VTACYESTLSPAGTKTPLENAFHFKPQPLRDEISSGTGRRSASPAVFSGGSTSAFAYGFWREEAHAKHAPKGVTDTSKDLLTLWWRKIKEA
jgi:hypothetical protein